MVAIDDGVVVAGLMATRGDFTDSRATSGSNTYRRVGSLGVGAPEAPELEDRGVVEVVSAGTKGAGGGRSVIAGDATYEAGCGC